MHCAAKSSSPGAQFIHRSCTEGSWGSLSLSLQAKWFSKHRLRPAARGTPWTGRFAKHKLLESAFLFVPSSLILLGLFYPYTSGYVYCFRLRQPLIQFPGVMQGVCSNFPSPKKIILLLLGHPGPGAFWNPLPCWHHLAILPTITCCWIPWCAGTTSAFQTSSGFERVLWVPCRNSPCWVSHQLVFLLPSQH